jgi:hypothetical protein
MTKLKEQLNLPIQTADMLYEHFAERSLGLSEPDIKEAKDFVNTEMAKIDSEEALSNWEPWQHVKREDQWRRFDFGSLGIATVADTKVDEITTESVSTLGTFFVLPEGQILSEESLKRCWIETGKDPYTRNDIKLEKLKRGKVGN